MHQNLPVESHDLGALSIDIAYGGNFYPIVEAQENFRDLADFDATQLLRMGVELRVGNYDAIIPGITGAAYITGESTLFVDSDEPFPQGFVL